MKKKIFFITLLVTAVLAAYAQDAQAIVQASRDRIKAETVSSRSRMVVRAKDGSTSERVIDQYSKDGPKGGRSMIVFPDVEKQPASVKGTRFLTMENKDSADDRWIFLPSLGKVRRIAASEGSGSFMGTDFSYDDISSMSRGADFDAHTLLREESAGGTACYVIQSVPKDASYQYSKMVQWIAKDSKIGMKIELYDKKNALVKTVEMSGVKDIQGKLTPQVTKISTHAAGTSTTINMEIIKYDDPIPEAVFTTAYLETGRAR
ncbi:MAG: outer membrane lipoprotein-sorting protein [Treponema sp.]|jgi:outer membrane lipoprotein-sorting protein|nr:outer membrane lipoprotein-sorting protein [Treponema sp.]